MLRKVGKLISLLMKIVISEWETGKEKFDKGREKGKMRETGNRREGSEDRFWWNG